ncbi:Y-family DNA polymerase [Levilactobacillus suantsaii]|uniref:LytTR family transcriptional regulator n=1 Tax=Levilactobacillus suantsaii TaxID=2292255 RepID=A0A4Q0VFB0_9LACO|nr:LytTR family transcriptional regulator [Levilactobacillus suantsaii]QMU08836.1 LytTR family transcriptional regulator [Levilactobacillus suantsaii]RXI76136.1 LytTR family transcriptional regulator [Levilactobacillus suantsaii]
MGQRVYIAIDLKSFYASAECAARGLDPLNTNLVVADPRRTDKTICLAVSPALKRFGLPGRPQLFEVEQQVATLNQQRAVAHHGRLTKSSTVRQDLLQHPEFKLDYLVAQPRMAYYLRISDQIYQIYLHYVAPEQIHVYSIDEVFMDVTAYLKLYHLSARDLAKRMIQDVQRQTRIPATAGIGTNLYLAKVAMDIVAKKIPADQDGVRIAKLNERSYRKYLWAHQPLTDFWRIGRGYARRLEKLGLHTMGDIARCSLGAATATRNEETLYQEFGRVAELIIDHAWGYESATLADIKQYQPSTHSIGSGQVLPTPYDYQQGELVVREMVDGLSLELVKRQQVCDQVVLTVAYDAHGRPASGAAVTHDFYGRTVPKPAHGSYNLQVPTSLTTALKRAVTVIYRRQVNPHYKIRKVTVSVGHVVAETAAAAPYSEQLALFGPTTTPAVPDAAARHRERRVQESILQVQDRFGKDAIMRATDLLDGATFKKRNHEIGGHQA